MIMFEKIAGLVAINDERKYVVTNLWFGSGPKPTTVASSALPKPSLALPEDQRVSSKPEVAQVGPGSVPSSRYFQVASIGTSGGNAGEAMTSTSASDSTSISSASPCPLLPERSGSGGRVMRTRP